MLIYIHKQLCNNIFAYPNLELFVALSALFPSSASLAIFVTWLSILVLLASEMQVHDKKKLVQVAQLRKGP